MSNIKNIQLFVCLLVIVQPIFSHSVSKQLSNKARPAQSRLGRSPASIAVPVHATAVVLQPAYYQPKVDVDLLQNHHQDLSSYSAVLEPSAGDIAALYRQAGDITKTSYSKGYEGLSKYTEAIYRTPQVVTYAKEEHSAPESFVTHVQKHSGDEHDDKHYASSYQFGYRVKDPHHGSYFGHSEANDGHNTKGQYHVLLPDGRLQNVKYTADHSGYHAHVSYDKHH